MHTLEEITPIIENAACILDFELEHWEDQVEIGGFGIHDATGCLLDRLYGGWSVGMDKLRNYDIHGNTCPFACDVAEEPMYIELWTKEIVKRRLNAIEIKEEVMV